MKRPHAAVFAAALLARALCVTWAAPRFPPAEDGRFYHVVAERIARGLGYTWAWPDGVVTFAAHYPVGYPAALAPLYALFGPQPVVAMLLNAALGSLAALAVTVLVEREAGARAGLVGGLAVAFHPSLVAYTPALMTEAVCGALLVIAAVLAPCRRGLWCLGAMSAALACLMRPQLVLLLPVLAWLAARAALPATRTDAAPEVVGGSSRGFAFPCTKATLRAAFTLALGLSLCVPWTWRNCSRLGRCVFVSANGGWNLLIGTAPEGRGAWIPIERVGVPIECREVFHEAAKDACFGAAARRRIAEAPLAWVALAPRKLFQTFDAPGAPGAYLRASNPGAFGESEKLVLGVAELVALRLGLVALGIAVWRVDGPRRRSRRVLAGVTVVAALLPGASLAVLSAALGLLLLGRRLLDRPALLLGASSLVLTALVHAVFFGAARYALTALLALLAAAATALAPRAAPRSLVEA